MWQMFVLGLEPWRSRFIKNFKMPFSLKNRYHTWRTGGCDDDLEDVNPFSEAGEFQCIRVEVHFRAQAVAGL
jgi:hypothetical protein